jgi:hypothetical protein
VLVALAVALLLAAPLLLGILGEVRQGVQAPGPTQALRNSATLAALVAPQPAQPLWAGAVAGWYERTGLAEGDEQILALGYVALALAAVGLVDRRARRIGWLLAMLVFLALALGPELHLVGREQVTELPSPLRMPYRVLQQVPLVGVGRAPARFVAPATLCLAILAAQGV